MKDKWVTRTKKFFHDDLSGFKLRKAIRREKSAPVLSQSFKDQEILTDNTNLKSVELDLSQPVAHPVEAPEEQVERPVTAVVTDLLDLPYELLNQIVLQLSSLCHGHDGLQSLLSLSSTCRSMRDVCIPHIFNGGSIECHNSGPIPRATTGYKTALQLYNGPNINITKNLCRLRIHQRKASAEVASTDLSKDFTVELQNSLQDFDRLHFIHLDPPTIPHTIILRNLKDRLLHVALDLRFSRANVAEVLPELADLVRTTSFAWSLATVATPNVYDLLRAVLHSQQAKAVLLDTTSFQHQQDFPLGPGTAYPALEELSIFRRSNERKRRVTALPASSIILQICEVMPDLINLKRLRIEGARMCEEVQAVLPLLSNLEELSLSAFDRGAFHTSCNFDEEHQHHETHDMSWLSLPKLKQFDLRFICHHFEISQLVPPGLRGLRIQFYSPDRHLTLDQLDWISSNCPDLERLEISLDLGRRATNVGSAGKDDYDVQIDFEKMQKLLHCLQSFRKLKTLRFFPAYWHEDGFVPQPLPSMTWPLDTFQMLRTKCHMLSALNISISSGEYQPHLISRLLPEKRPLRFVVEQHGRNDLLRYRFGFPDSAQMAQRFVDRGKAVGPREIVMVRPELFLDDHTSGWIFPVYEVAYNNSRAWLVTGQGQQYLDHLENGCFK